MDIRRTRWVDWLVTAAALLTALEICDLASVTVSRSLGTWLLFASSFIGLQRIYAAVVDLILILSQRQLPGDNRAA